MTKVKIVSSPLLIGLKPGKIEVSGANYQVSKDDVNVCDTIMN